MQGFLSTAASLLGALPGSPVGTGTPPRPRLAVVQFSNDCRVEAPLAPAPAPGSEAALEWEAAMAGMVGGGVGKRAGAAVCAGGC